MEIKKGDKVKVISGLGTGIINLEPGELLTVMTVNSGGGSFEPSKNGHNWIFDFCWFENGWLELVESRATVLCDHGEVGVPRVKVFPQARNPEPGQPTINTVIEFPIDPRAVLAGMAMQGMLANPSASGMGLETIADGAIAQADALLVRLNPPPCGERPREDDSGL